MTKKKNILKKIFGRKFGISDILLLVVMVGYPLLYFANLQTGFNLINENFTFLVIELGDIVWGGSIIAFFVRPWIRKAKE